VLFISVAVGLLSHLLLVRQVEARLGLGLASVFGVVSSYVVAAGNLPESGELTLSDKLHITGMAFVFLSILASVAVFRLADRLGDPRTERLDRWLGVALTLGYAAAVTLLCLAR
jgi:Ca2+/Na+ antiporter